MVSYKELIYSFVDIYLQTAIECSICRESYEMRDDNQFIEDYIHFFISLVNAVENNKDLNIEDINNTLRERADKVMMQFDSYLKFAVLENALEKTKTQFSFEEYCSFEQLKELFEKNFKQMYDEIFDEEFNNYLNKCSPKDMMEHLRKKEEAIIQQ